MRHTYFFVISTLLFGISLIIAPQPVDASTILQSPKYFGLNADFVGYWNFDDKTVSGTHVYDASGTGNRGIMTNGHILTEGKLGQGMQFDGGG